MANENKFQPGFEYTLESGDVIRVYLVSGITVEGSRTSPDGKLHHFCTLPERLYVVGEGVDRRIDVNKTYVTREGKSVRVLATDLRNDRPILAAVTTSNGRETALAYYPDGRQYMSLEDDDDLVEVKPVSFEADEVVEVLAFGEWVRYHYRKLGSGRHGDFHTVWDEGRSSNTARDEYDFFSVDPKHIRKLE